MNEIRADALLKAAYEQHLPLLHRLSPNKRIESWEHRFMWAGFALEANIDIYYVLPRLLQPELVVETGVASGSMTSWLLAALCRNGKGELWSYDLPPQEGERSMGWSVGDEGVGFLIPQEYQAPWTLQVGDSTELLPATLMERKVDIFVHDSDHSYAHQVFEYAFASKVLRHGGLLLSDDVGWTPAFQTFTEHMGWPTFAPARNPNLGVAVVAQNGRPRSSATIRKQARRAGSKAMRMLRSVKR